MWPPFAPFRRRCNAEAVDWPRTIHCVQVALVEPVRRR